MITFIRIVATILAMIVVFTGLGVLFCFVESFRNSRFFDTYAFIAAVHFIFPVSSFLLFKLNQHFDDCLFW